MTTYRTIRPVILVIAGLAILLIAGAIGWAMQSRNADAALDGYLGEVCHEEWAQETWRCSSR